MNAVHFPKERARTVDAVPSPEESKRADCESVSASAQAEKDFSTLRAEAALTNIVVHRMAGEDGGPSFLVGRWSWSRTCATLDEARALIRRMAGVSR